MKTILTLSAAGALLAALANGEQLRYTVTDLGVLPGGNFSEASSIANNGLIPGLSVASDFSQHAVLWYKGRILDIGTPGRNSGAFSTTENGEILLQVEGALPDPNHENFCAYGTGLKCLPALWQNGATTLLPLLGGNNGTVGLINNKGEASGVAEKATVDPSCAPGVAVNGTGPQVLNFKAVIWGKKGEVQELPSLPGDSVGIAMAINDKGEAVGVSGSCGNTILPPFASGPHAVRWEKDGSVHDLGNLGGTVNPTLLGIGNIAFGINNRGDVVGASALPGNTNNRAFLWTKDKGMQNLGTLPGDVNSASLAINENGDVVGASVQGAVGAGHSRAFLWQNNMMYDLNALVVPGGPPMLLLLAVGINSGGEIVGLGLNLNTFEPHGFLATPSHK